MDAIAVVVMREWVADSATSLAVGALLIWLGHRHIVRPARRRHEEIKKAIRGEADE